MKDLFVFLRRFVRPYRKNLVGSVLFNLLSALLNVFSFALIVPILQILFKISENVYEYTPVYWGMKADDFTAALRNNFYFKVTEFIGIYGEANTLLVLGLVLILMTFFKTGCYFGSSAIMVPLRSGTK